VARNGWEVADIPSPLRRAMLADIERLLDGSADRSKAPPAP